MSLACGFALLLVALVAAACSGDDDTVTHKLFTSPPWTGPETYTYNLKQSGDPAGTCTLKTEPNVEPGKTRLSRMCSDGKRYEDNGSVTVDATTLAPIESTRVFVDSEKNKKTTYTNTYEGPQVVFHAVDQDGHTNNTTRDLPTPSAKDPDPGWYDDEELLWLVRGLPLQQGYGGTYTHVINAGQPRVLPVDVHVDAPQQVKVPAGEFSAYRVRVQKDDSIYQLWVDTAAPHKVVKAQIEDATYELTGTG